MDRFENFLEKHPKAGNDTPAGPAEAFAGSVSFGSAYTKDEYLAKANNCFHEAEIYQDKANRSDDKYEIKHNLDEAKKWRDRGENYLQQAKYADDKNK